MQRRARIRSAVMLGASMCFGGAAMAGDPPKEGTDSFTFHWKEDIASQKFIEALDGRHFSTFQLNGTLTNNAGGEMFNNYDVHCFVRSESAVGKTSYVGVCTDTDGDGDHILRIFEGSLPGGGRDEVVGGSGKFAGIAGTGEWSDTKGDLRGTELHKITWRLP
jgi:hypothetical protein